LLFSFFLWILGQFDFLFLVLHRYANNYSISLGSYNILAWQFVFVFGMWACWKFKIKKQTVLYNKYILLTCLAIAIVFFIGRQIVAIYRIPHGDLLLHKENLRILRLFNFIMLVYLVGWLVQKSFFIKSSFLSFIGKHSLVVFSFQIILIYSIQPFRSTIAQYGIGLEALICTALVLSLLVPAWLHEHYKKSKIMVKTS